VLGLCKGLYICVAVTDLFQRTEQELYHEREKLKSQVAFPDESSSNLNLSTRFQIKVSMEDPIIVCNIRWLL